MYINAKWRYVNRDCCRCFCLVKRYWDNHLLCFLWYKWSGLTRQCAQFSQPVIVRFDFYIVLVTPTDNCHSTGLAGLDNLTPLLESEFGFGICDFIHIEMASLVILDFWSESKNSKKSKDFLKDYLIWMDKLLCALILSAYRITANCQIIRLTDR